MLPWYPTELCGGSEPHASWSAPSTRRCAHAAGRLAARLRVLAAGLDAFATDLADLPRPWTLLVVSEFGRRLRANRSGGTDHGRAGLMLALGGGAGRRFGLARHFGAWPGLTPEALDEGVDLRVATDYRAVLRAVVAELAPAGPRVGI